MTSALLAIDRLPVLQNVTYGTVEEARGCPVGSIELRLDPRTGIVTNLGFDPGLIKYETSYNNEQAYSEAFRSHLDRIAELIEDRCDMRKVVEVGCGKGHFLRLLSGRGHPVTGFDPTFEGDDPRVRRELFGSDARIRATTVILRHVLEHIPDPWRFLAMIREANGGSGWIYVEVPCFDWICRHRAWFDVFYEHVNYFRESDFRRMFGSIRSIARTFGGQYLSVVADLSSLRPMDPGYDPAPSIPEDFFASLGGSIEADPPGAPAAIWGAASKGVIFAWHRARAGRPVTHVIDRNPGKQGRFLPCTGLRVLSPELALSELAPRSCIWVMNSNYLEEIAAKCCGRFDLRAIDRLVSVVPDPATVAVSPSEVSRT